jgi:hypothetical protein
VLWRILCRACAALRRRPVEVTFGELQVVLPGLPGRRAGRPAEWAVKGPVGDLAAHAEAIERVAELTGIRRGPTQIRKFLAGLGFAWQWTRASLVPPKQTCRNTRNTWPTSVGFSMAN